MDRDLAEDARRAYKDHLIRKQSPGRWLLQRQYTDGKWAGSWDSSFYTEIICLEGGQLFVGGDIDHTIFAYYSDSTDFEARLRWIGKHSVDSYIVEKACIGTGRELIEIWDQDQAEKDVTWRVEYLRKHDQEDGTDHSVEIDEYEYLLAYFPNNEHEVCNKIYDIEPSSAPDLFPIGMTTSPRVYFAHAAIQRLLTLLEEKNECDLCRGQGIVTKSMTKGYSGVIHRGKHYSLGDLCPAENCKGKNERENE